MSSEFPYEEEGEVPPRPMLPYGSFLRWRSPKTAYLEGKAFEGGDPDFDPVPSVTLVTKTVFCPVLAIHELLHGLSSPLCDADAEDMGGVYRFGEVYHDVIRRLKEEMRGGWNLSPQEMVERMKELAGREGKGMWSRMEYYASSWVENRKKEGNVIAGENTLFEVHVAGEVEFLDYMGKVKKAPLMGRIDELDLDRGVLVERTVRSGEEEPPTMKDYQAWLLLKLLKSIDPKDVPEGWRRDFSKFSAVVETPHRTYEVREKPEWEEKTVEALSIIQNLSQKEEWVSTAIRVYREGYRKCREEGKSRRCGMGECLAGGRMYPKCRASMRAKLNRYCRAFLNETAWRKWLADWRLLRCTLDELEGVGVLFRGRVLKKGKGWVRIELSPEASKALRVGRGEVGCSLLWGTPRFGMKVWATLEKVEETTCTMRCKDIPNLEEISLLLEEETSILRLPPVFLNSMRQRELFKLGKWGLDKEEEARAHPVIQLEEACFGSKILRMGGEDEKEEKQGKKGE